MANTYTLIASNTLTSTSASVTFSSIPGTYTDLVLRVSARTDNSSSGATSLLMRFNSDTGSNYSRTYIIGENSTSSSSRASSASNLGISSAVVNNLNTSNTFSSAEIYIPSYTVSQNKPIGSTAASENNSTTNWEIGTLAGLWRNTAAITSIECYLSGINFVSGSSFFLYGIKNS